MKELDIAGERIGLLDRIDDDDELADRALRGDGAQRLFGLGGLTEKIADEQDERTGAGGRCGGSVAFEGP